MSNLVKKKKKKKRNLSYSNPNLVRRSGSRIYPMQARLYGRYVTFSVMYLPVSRCPVPRLKSVVLTHPSTRLDMYYSTTCACGMTNMT